MSAVEDDDDVNAFHKTVKENQKEASEFDDSGIHVANDRISNDLSDEVDGNERVDDQDGHLDVTNTPGDASSSSGLMLGCLSIAF